MNRRKAIFTVLIPVLLIILFGIYNYLICIYEVIYKVNPEFLYADNKSEITITAIPLNGSGGKALFRKVEAGYLITAGSDLVKIVEKDTTEGILKLRAGNIPGQLEIIAESPYALLPSSITIMIYPDHVEVKHEVNGII